MLVVGLAGPVCKGWWGVVSGFPSPLCAALGGFGFFRLAVYYFAVYVLWVVQCGFG